MQASRRGSSWDTFRRLMEGGQDVHAGKNSDGGSHTAFTPQIRRGSSRRFSQLIIPEWHFDKGQNQERVVPRKGRRIDSNSDEDTEEGGLGYSHGPSGARPADSASSGRDWRNGEKEVGRRRRAVASDARAASRTLPSSVGRIIRSGGSGISRRGGLIRNQRGIRGTIQNGGHWKQRGPTGRELDGAGEASRVAKTDASRRRTTSREGRVRQKTAAEPTARSSSRKTDRPPSVRRCSLLPHEKVERQTTSTRTSRKASAISSLSPDCGRAIESSEQNRRPSSRTAEAKDIGKGWNRFLSEKKPKVPTFVPSIMNAPKDEIVIQKKAVRRRGVMVGGKKVRADLVKKGTEKQQADGKAGKVTAVDHERTKQLIALLSGATYEFIGMGETSKQDADKAQWFKGQGKERREKPGHEQKHSDKSKQGKGQTQEQPGQKRRGSRVDVGRRASEVDEKITRRGSKAEDASKRRLSRDEGESKRGEGDKAKKKGGQEEKKAGEKAKRDGRESKKEEASRADKPAKSRREVNAAIASKKPSAPVSLPPLAPLDDPALQEQIRNAVFRSRPVTAITEEEEDPEEVARAILARTPISSATAKKLESVLSAANLLIPTMADPSRISTITASTPFFQMPMQTWGVRQAPSRPISRPTPQHPQKFTYHTYADNLIHPNVLLPPFHIPPIKQILYGPYEAQLWEYFKGQAGWLSMEGLDVGSEKLRLLIHVPTGYAQLVPVDDG